MGMREQQLQQGQEAVAAGTGANLWQPEGHDGHRGAAAQVGMGMGGTEVAAKLLCLCGLFSSFQTDPWMVHGAAGPLGTHFFTQRGLYRANAACLFCCCTLVYNIEWYQARAVHL